MAASNSNPNTSLKVAPEAEFKEDIQRVFGKVSEMAGNPQKMSASYDRPWTTSLFDCFSPFGLCFKTFCCPCITAGQTHHRLNRSANLEGYSCCNGFCCLYFIALHFGLHCVPNLIQRSDMKERFGLEGNFALDCLKACCCNCCDLIQQDKEAALLLGANNVVMEQPGKVDNMNYGPPGQAPLQGNGQMTYPYPNGKQ